MSLAAEQLAQTHLAAGRPLEALKAIESAAKAWRATHQTLALYSKTLKALMRMDECLAVRRLITERFPTSGVAWHNLASALIDLGDSAGAIAACRKAFAAKIDAPETWLTYARALRNEGKLNDALAAYDQLLRRKPNDADALMDKAKLVWKQTGDVERAAAVFPQHPFFALAVVGLHHTAGDLPRARELAEAALQRQPSDLALLQSVAGLALEAQDVERAVVVAANAFAQAPNEPTVQQLWAVALLAAGRADEVLPIARKLVERAPFNGSVVALLATAARIAGAPEYEQLYDYPNFVRAYDLSAPPGWSDLDAFLIELRATLNDLHDKQPDSAQHSSRNGTQTRTDLLIVNKPVVKVFFAAIDPLIRQYQADIGQGADPLRSRNTGGFHWSGSWSTRLNTSGHHVDHLHPRGWMSSAFYVDVPEVAHTGADHEGWIQFGRPSLLTKPKLEAAHFVQPVPGRLVLFPSYMWHGTVPFTSNEKRITIAFDVLPKD